jgi:ElaB/YqjD/DUF883 family membrane-anchored ribosome-binding protein
LLSVAMSKQDFSREDWEEAMRELRKEYDRKLSEMDKHLRKSIAREQEEVDEEELEIGSLRQGLNVARGKISGAIKRGDDTVTAHPLLVVGGALAIGVVVGALLATRGRED